MLIDIVSRIGDEVSQTLIVDKVLNRPNVTSEDLRRVFIHCVAMENATEVSN